MDAYGIALQSLACLPLAMVFSGWPVYLLTSRKQCEYQTGWKKWMMRAWFVLGLLLAWLAADGPLPAEDLAAMKSMATSEKALALARMLELWVMVAIMFGGWPYYFIRCHPGTRWVEKCFPGYLTMVIVIFVMPTSYSVMHPSELLLYFAMAIPFILVLTTALIRRRRPAKMRLIAD